MHAGGCIAKGCPPRGGCCRKKWPLCYSRKGKCWCDAACWFFRDCCEDILLIGCSKSKYSCSNEQFIASYLLQLDRHVLLLMFALWMDYLKFVFGRTMLSRCSSVCMWCTRHVSCMQNTTAGIYISMHSFSAKLITFDLSHMT